MRWYYLRGYTHYTAKRGHALNSVLHHFCQPAPWTVHDGNRLLNPSLISITLSANDPCLLPIDDMIVFYYMVSNGRFMNNRLLRFSGGTGFYVVTNDDVRGMMGIPLVLGVDKEIAQRTIMLHRGRDVIRLKNSRDAL